MIAVYYDVWYPANLLLKTKPELCLLPEVGIIRTTQKGAKHIPSKAINKWSLADWSHDELKRVLKCTPNRGLKAMIDILNGHPKEFYITGFTFYQGSAYYPGYTTEKDNNKQFEKGGNVGGYLQEPQMQYFRNRILPFVKVDWKLQEMFK